MATSAPTTHAISVRVAANVIDYGNKKKCHVRKKDEIGWESSGPFAIEFRDASPLNGTSFQSTLVDGKHRLIQPVVGGPLEIELLYACALYSGEKVYLDARCPAIIIDP